MTNGEIRSTKWVSYGRWMQPPLSGAFWTHGHESKSVHELISDREFTQLLFLDGYTMSSTDDEMWYDAYAAKLIADPELAGHFYDRLETVAAKYEKQHLALLTSDLGQMAYVRELFRTYNEMIGVWWFPISLSMALEKRILNGGMAPDEASMAEKVAPYARPTLLEKQTKEIKILARLALERHSGLVPESVTEELLASDTELQTAVERHVVAFSWFGTHHWGGEAYTTTKCLADIRDVLTRGVAQANTAHPAPPADEHAYLWKLIALFAYWRTHAAEVTAQVVFNSRTHLTELASEWNLTYDDLTYLSAIEVLRFLDIGSLELPENFAERRAGYGSLVENGHERIVTGHELAELVDLLVPKVDHDVREFKGTVASKGKLIRGIARIVLAPSDFGNFNDGDILVANETTPDFVPLMKKAGAIITDTGGITSHAAIVSRELKVPCIIGTKIATKALREGDVIEVDTEKGTVKVLERVEV